MADDDRMNHHTVVVGYNTSPSSTEAVLWAAAEATARSVNLCVIACYDMPLDAALPPSWTSTDVVDRVIDAVAQPAGAMKKLLHERYPELHVDMQVSPGPATEILHHDLKPSDLMVVGSNSHGLASGYWLGSTARAVVRHSPCPVVVIRGAASRGRPDRIVVGVDGSDSSAKALMWAADEADLHGVELAVVHSWFYPYLGVDTHAAQVRELTQIDAACVLEESVESARERCGVTVTAVLVEDGPGSALLGVVKDGDLLVLGSRGRSAIASSLLGSTVNNVLDEAAVPVVVVR